MKLKQMTVLFASDDYFKVTQETLQNVEHELRHGAGPATCPGGAGCRHTASVPNTDEWT